MNTKIAIQEPRKTNTRKSLREFVLLSLFVALIFLLGLTPIGLIPLGFCNVTLLCIPVSVGAIYFGWKKGLLLGLAFGAASFVSALTRPSALVETLMGANMFYVIVMTFLPRLVVPLTVAGVYALLAKKQKHVAAAVAAACGSLTNTVLYLGLMLLFYTLCGIDNSAVLTTIAAVAGAAGPAEAIAGAIICPPVLAAVSRIRTV